MRGKRPREAAENPDGKIKAISGHFSARNEKSDKASAVGPFRSLTGGFDRHYNYSWRYSSCPNMWSQNDIYERTKGNSADLTPPESRINQSGGNLRKTGNSKTNRFAELIFIVC